MLPLADLTGVLLSGGVALWLGVSTWTSASQVVIQGCSYVRRSRTGCRAPQARHAWLSPPSLTRVYGHAPSPQVRPRSWRAAPYARSALSE